MYKVVKSGLGPLFLLLFHGIICVFFDLSFYFGIWANGGFMSRYGNDTLSAVEELLEPLLLEKKLELVDIEIKGRGAKKLLRIYIDKQGGVTVDDCASLSRELGVLLDVHDLIAESYTLEISSPGLRRALKGPKDYERFVGKKVKIKTYDDIEKRNLFIGRLVEYRENTAHLDVDGVKYLIPLENIQKANLELDF